METQSGSKFFSTKALLLYAIIGVIIGMISALGTVAVVVDYVAQVIALVGIVKLIVETVKKRAVLGNWVLFFVLIIIYYLSRVIGYI